MKVPFLDLKAQYESIKKEINPAIQEVLDSSAFAGGPFVKRFEDEWAAFCNCSHAVGVGSGTDALWFTLLALGIGQGDEVVTVPNTFIATAEAISFCGATPIFIDVEESTSNMDPEKLGDFLKNKCICAPSSQRIINKTSKRLVKAVIPVHLYGRMADMDPIMKVAGEYGLPVIEDASQAHGALYKGKVAGSIGDAGCFSFYPGKNLGAYGEAGAVVTNDEELAHKIRVLRDHGQQIKNIHSMIGWNGRMDGIQGAVLSVKLKHLNEWTDARRKAAMLYDRKLEKFSGLKIPAETSDTKHVYHIYAVQTKNRDHLMQYLQENGITCGIHYPVPLHLQKAYRHISYKKGSYPVAEKSAGEIVSLPIFPELTELQIDHVADTIERWFSSSEKGSSER
jgi:dTDP-4-amino-4,6-dideoxygalactose transaminase